MKLKLNKTKAIFIIYFIILIWLVLFKMAFSLNDIQALYAPQSINLIPFYYSTDVGKIHIKEALLNVFIFIPFGIYLKMLNVSGKKAILFGCLCSLFFELCQLIFSIGAVDISDLITNTVGVILGVCLYAFLVKILKNKQKIDKTINIIATAILIIFISLSLLLFIANY